MKLLFSIVTTSMACGFFAGRCFSDGWAWCLAVLWVAWTGVRWVRDEIDNWDINEVEI